MRTPIGNPASPRQAVTRLAVATGLILLIPLIAMQFSDDVEWTVADFVVMGALLFSGGLALAYISQRVSKHRGLLIVATLAVMVWVWAELAVGVFTDLGS